ncbi:MAG: hypothetical protein HY840_10405 [Bacteroidetes bacterium]|nr:hypothetical protein [Bacteroidota bacterium]
MKKTKSDKKTKPVKKAAKKKVTSAHPNKKEKELKKKHLAVPAGKSKVKGDWQEDSLLEEEEKQEDEEFFAGEEEPKLENLDDALDGDEDEEEDQFFGEEPAF